jgi:hypothetical protein
MKFLALAAFLLMTVGAVENKDCPFLHLKEKTSKDGKIHLFAKNTANQPILAYIVLGVRNGQQSVWKGIYTNGSMLKAGSSVEVGEVPGVAGTTMTKLVVDFVRLGDGTSWGEVSTEEAKEAVARFQKGRNN